MTARHVLVDANGRSCTARVIQEGTDTAALVSRWMAIRVARSKAPTDLALAVLGTPLTGYDFSISPSSPARGDLVAAFGYALGQPLSLNQGHVTGLVTANKVRLIEMDLLEAGGASGGPILNASGQVVGLTQVGGGGTLLSVDLAHLVRDDPAQFCIGIAAGQAATICGGARNVALLEPDGPPGLCLSAFGSFPNELPFQACPKVPELALGVLSIEATCPKTHSVESSGFLIGPRLMMTNRSALIDPATGQTCRATVHQDYTFTSDPVVRWIAVQRTDSATSLDVAIALLAKPLQGHDFSLSQTSPKVGELVHRLDFLDEAPSYENRAHISKLVTSSGIRQFVIREPGVDGSGGGPIVDSANRVVALVQSLDTKTNEDYSVDLAHVTDGDPSQFCIGLVAGYVSTVCPTNKTLHPTLLSRATPPETCGKFAEDPPFTFCISKDQVPGVASVSASPYTKLKISGCWVTTAKPVSSANAFDESQEIATMSDVMPQIYFVYHFNQLRSGMSLSISAQSPSGLHAVIASGPLRITNPNSTYWRQGPYSLLQLDPMPDGTWTISAKITSGPGAGSTCSYDFNVTPPSP